MLLFTNPLFGCAGIGLGGLFDATSPPTALEAKRPASLPSTTITSFRLSLSAGGGAARGALARSARGLKSLELTSGKAERVLEASGVVLSAGAGPAAFCSLDELDDLAKLAGSVWAVTATVEAGDWAGPLCLGLSITRVTAIAITARPPAHRKPRVQNLDGAGKLCTTRVFSGSSGKLRATISRQKAQAARCSTIWLRSPAGST